MPKLITGSPTKKPNPVKLLSKGWYEPQYQSHYLSEELFGLKNYMEDRTNKAQGYHTLRQVFCTYRAFNSAIACVYNAVADSPTLYQNLKATVFLHIKSTQDFLKVPEYTLMDVYLSRRLDAREEYYRWYHHITHNYLVLVLVMRIMQGRGHPNFRIPKSIKDTFVEAYRKLNIIRSFMNVT